ncbi:GlxA family transcriptional regulator [Singulisphaera sp. PoT]|uniref:GlxA family transcriptional regulator n=1 Tax=Singulisphaera sp. PoT TaxID=3411797 RepID=UPI003BF4B10E
MAKKPAAPIASPGRRKVVMAVVGQPKLLDIAGPLQVFTDARHEDGRNAYDVILASEGGGPVTTDSGIVLASERLEEALNGEVDTLLLTGGDSTSLPKLSKAMHASLTRSIGRPRRLGSICVGAFMLADLGVLDGHEATTHWQVCEQLQREFPSVRVRPDAIFIAEGGIWTSAGISAGIDMALAMVEDDLGHAAALTLARFLVLFLKRPGGQSQFSVELRRQTQDARGRFDDLHSWIRENLDDDLSVSALASVAHMSPRNFARVYQRETGVSPAAAVERMRVEAAIRWLESTSETIQRIAHRAGFGDDERMRRAFLRSYGVSPQDYRSRFGRQPR